MSIGSTVGLDLERYLKGVLPAEIYESRTPPAAMRAQAVAARTYALGMMLRGEELSDTSRHQSYRAALAAASPNCARAVDHTAGQVLAYLGELIECFYSNSNGGVTRLPQDVWKKALPYYAKRADIWDDGARVMAIRQGRKITISHGVGLSQAGAEYAALMNEDYIDILRFYYPGAQLGYADEIGGVRMTNEQAMREFVLSLVGCGYIYGATGWVCSEKRRREQAAQYPDYADVIMSTGAKWDGRKCYDCAQLTRRAMELIGLKPPSGAGSQYKRTDLYSQAGPISELPAGRMAQLFRVKPDGSVPHTGIALGDGTEVDARGHADGVVRMALNRYPWTHYKLISGGLDEFTGTAPAEPVPVPETPEQPNQPDADPPAGIAIVLQAVRMRTSMDTSSSANVVRQLGVGEQTRILGPLIKRGSNWWIYLETDNGTYVHRGHAVARDDTRTYLQLPAGMDADEAPEPEKPEKMYQATITGLSAAQVDQLVKAWPQALIREV